MGRIAGGRRRRRGRELGLRHEQDVARHDGRQPCGPIGRGAVRRALRSRSIRASTRRNATRAPGRSRLTRLTRPPMVRSRLGCRYNPEIVSSEGQVAPPAVSVAVPVDGRALEERLTAVPRRPGVYLLKDRHGKVIYIGKAANLRSRVRSYLRGGDERSQVRFLVERLAEFETLVTASDKEALILENNLIKQYRPRYNIRLKDDKSYVSVKVTIQDSWPRVLVTRKIVKDGSRYFGPFHSAQAVRETLDTIRKIIPLRTCSDGVFRNRSRPCLEYQIKRCLGPCCLPVDPEEYRRHLREAIMLLEGKSQQLVHQLEADMERAAADLRFEEAARLRDQIRAIERTQEKQQVG